jgi:hypothetical protein
MSKWVERRYIRYQNLSEIDYNNIVLKISIIYPHPSLSSFFSQRLYNCNFHELKHVKKKNICTQMSYAFRKGDEAVNKLELAELDRLFIKRLEELQKLAIEI